MKELTPGEMTAVFPALAGINHSQCFPNMVLKSVPPQLAAAGADLRRHDIEPELKFIHIAQHLIQLRAIAGHFHFTLILRLF